MPSLNLSNHYAFLGKATGFEIQTRDCVHSLANRLSLFPSGCRKKKFNCLIIFTSKDEISVIEDEQGSKRQNVASEKDSPVGVTQADDESNKDVSKLLSLDAYI